MKGRLMRARAKSGGVVWCAKTGDERNTNHADDKQRYWWKGLSYG